MYIIAVPMSKTYRPREKRDRPKKISAKKRDRWDERDIQAEHIENEEDDDHFVDPSSLR
jgi:hypothetical protein